MHTKKGGDCIRRIVAAGALLLSVLLGMCGCGQPGASAKLTRVVLERGHGSMWGNQFYIDICPTQINQIRFFSPEDPGGELLIRENLPIQQEQWEAIESAVNTLKLQKLKSQNTSRFQQDGGEFHKLTLTWDQEEIAYRWPTDGSGDGLEQLLESLIPQLN